MITLADLDWTIERVHAVVCRKELGCIPYDWEYVIWVDEDADQAVP